MEASQKLGEKMYADAQAAQAAAEANPGAAPGDAGGSKPNDDNVVDAEFEEVKEGKK